LFAIPNLPPDVILSAAKDLSLAMSRGLRSFAALRMTGERVLFMACYLRKGGGGKGEGIVERRFLAS